MRKIKLPGDFSLIFYYFVKKKRIVFLTLLHSFQTFVIVIEETASQQRHRSIKRDMKSVSVLYCNM